MRRIRRGKVVLALVVCIGLLLFVWNERGVDEGGIDSSAVGIAAVPDQSVFSPESKILVTEQYWCGDEKSKTMSPESWLGRPSSILYNDFPPEDGWELQGTLPGTINVLRSTEDFCPKHQAYRHLGLSQGKLVIYQGPLGNQQVLLQVEDILVKDLPEKLQEHLRAARNYKNLDDQGQVALQASLQFVDDVSLNAYLDNLDEFRRD